MFRRLLVVCLVVVGSGCTSALRPPAIDASSARAQLEVEMVEGNAVDILRNGEVFDALEQEIARAQSSVHIILFIWRPGEPSDRITAALVERARHGVRCRVVIDPFWSKGFDTQVKPRLEAAGCQVHIFEPLAEVRAPAQLVRREHRKLVVIDGRVGFTGGFGMWRSWLGDGSKKDEWRDVAVRFRGPVVAQAQKVFERDWKELTGNALEPDSYPPLVAEGHSRALFVGSESPVAGGVSEAQRLHSWLIGEARQRIWISNSYFVPSDEMSRALVDKAANGVDVRVVAPGDKHDMPFVRAAQRSTYEALVRGGVGVWEFEPTMMHSKSLVVDDRYAMVSSINLDPMSMREARECGLVVDDPEVAQALAADFLWDQARSRPMYAPTLHPWQSLARVLMWTAGSI
ncbi:MAG: phospholipase D-like domain-containing protein [Myxococcaceae bacterium]